MNSIQNFKKNLLIFTWDRYVSQGIRIDTNRFCILNGYCWQQNNHVIGKYKIQI